MLVGSYDFLRAGHVGARFAKHQGELTTGPADADRAVAMKSRGHDVQLRGMIELVDAHDLGVVRDKRVGQDFGRGGVETVAHWVAPAGMEARFASRNRAKSAAR